MARITEETVDMFNALSNQQLEMFKEYISTVRYEGDFELSEFDDIDEDSEELDCLYDFVEERILGGI